MSLLTALGLASLLFTAAFTWCAYMGNESGGGQSRRESIIEAWANICAGFSVNFVANLLLLPLVGAHFSLLDNLWLGWVYTAISIVRSYTIRRWFNDRIHRFAARAAQRIST